MTTLPTLQEPQVTTWLQTSRRTLCLEPSGARALLPASRIKAPLLPQGSGGSLMPSRRHFDAEYAVEDRFEPKRICARSICRPPRDIAVWPHEDCAVGVDPVSLDEKAIAFFIPGRPMT